MSPDISKNNRLEEMITISIREKLGIIILSLHPKASFGKRKSVNVWLRLDSPNLDLAGLVALQLSRNWGSDIRILSVVNKEDDIDKAEKFLNKIADRARMPSETELSVLVGKFEETIAKAPRADLNIIGISDDPNCERMHRIVRLLDTSCLFVNDSGKESVFA